MGTHSAFGEKSHTRAHTAKQGPSLPRPQRGFALPVKFFYSATLLYTYISRFYVDHHHQQQLHLRPSFIAFFNLSHKWPTFAFTSESGYTLGFRRKIAHSGSRAETCVPLMWRFWGSHAILMVTGSRSKVFSNFLKIDVRNRGSNAFIK